MKIIQKSIPKFQASIFFSPIREKTDFIMVLLQSMKILLLPEELTKQSKDIDYMMKLVIDKMSRLFFYENLKYYSISFPFFISYDFNNYIKISTYSGKELTNKNISDIISILNSYEFSLNKSLIDYSIEPNSDIDFQSISILEEMFMLEPSYIRYDYDQDNENGNIHPLNHLDLNYSQYSTFKLGLTETIDKDFFENIQNIKTDCLFLHQH